MGFATLCLVFFMAEIAVKTIAASITQVNKTSASPQIEHTMRLDQAIASIATKPASEWLHTLLCVTFCRLGIKKESDHAILQSRSISIVISQYQSHVSCQDVRGRYL